MDSLQMPGLKTRRIKRLGMNLGDVVEIPERTQILGRKRRWLDSHGGSNSKRFNKSDLLWLVTGAYYDPKADPERPLGQDAYFMCEQTFGIADGVGGLIKDGIDSGVYARELMDNAYEFLQFEASGAEVDPANVLDYAYETSTAPGASTACIITLADNILHAVNLGDSGFLVIRNEEVVYRSPFQQSGFNCPYQLGVSTRRKPRNAMDIEFEVDSGDVIVAATDGLFDNLFNSQIEDIVNSSYRDDQLPDVIARNLVREARAVSLSRKGVTPWTVAAVDSGLEQKSYLGGKYDDITVVVACIY